MCMGNENGFAWEWEWACMDESLEREMGMRDESGNELKEVTVMW